MKASWKHNFFGWWRSILVAEFSVAACLCCFNYNWFQWFRSNRNERHEGSINPSEMLQIKRPTGKIGGCRNQTQKKLSQDSQKNLWIISSIWKELVENSKASENSNPRYSSNTWPSIWLMDFKTMAFCCCPSLSGGFGGNSPNLMGITFLGVDEVYDASMEWTCTSRDCTSYDGEIKNTTRRIVW